MFFRYENKSYLQTPPSAQAVVKTHVQDITIWSVQGICVLIKILEGKLVHMNY